MAEGAGFEPAIRFPAYTLSRRAPSTTRPPLRDFAKRLDERPFLPARPGFPDLPGAAEQRESAHYSAPRSGRNLVDRALPRLESPLACPKVQAPNRRGYDREWLSQSTAF